MRRGFWFVAGAGAGVYVVLKARRAAEVFTPEGLRDRVAGLSVGAQLFAEEVRSGMTEREAELRERLALLGQHSVLDGPLILEAAPSNPESHAGPHAGPHPESHALEGRH